MKVTPRFKPARPVKRKRARDRRDGTDPKYLKVIAQLPSCISGERPCHPHHLRIAEERGVALKATDKWALPLTWSEHLGAVDCVHAVAGADELQWFKDRGVDALALAAKLWDAYRRGAGVDQLSLIVEGRGKV